MLQLKNPDHPYYSKKENKIISLEQALILYEECFSVDSPFPEHNKQNEYISYAFQRAFLRLPGIDDGPEQDTYNEPDVGKKKKKKNLPKNRKKKATGASSGGGESN